MINKGSHIASQILRYDWRLVEIKAVYELPLRKLLFLAAGLDRAFRSEDELEGCSLLSIKTGGCPEDCGYCPQSAHYSTGVERKELLGVEEVVEAARSARAIGAARFCMGAAWREAPSGEQFSRVLEMVRAVRALGLEACCTLGMLKDWQCAELADAGLTAYNHNLDTSREYYGSVITTRTYNERLETLEMVRRAGITVCCGGIIGMGESRADRFGLLRQLCSMRPHPESVPINLLNRVSGTPLGDAEPLDVFELVRTIATARVVMPASTIRLSAGRESLSDEAQLLCFVAGANSIFIGERLLTTPNPSAADDLNLLSRLGMKLSRGREVVPSWFAGVE